MLEKRDYSREYGYYISGDEEGIREFSSIRGVLL